MEIKNIEYRYELKFVITQQAADLLKRQLAMVMDLDSHSVCEEYSYFIRSMYFDDPLYSAYHEKVNGDQFRAKYRLRMYNNDPEYLRLECKHKDDDMTYKEDCKVSQKVAEIILAGQYSRIQTKNDFLNRFLTEAKVKGLRPSVIVDYKRLAFVHPVSEIRITFDQELRSGRYSTDFFNEDVTTYPIYPDGQMVLEVKCNEYIPDHILTILSNVPKLRQAVSKFALCKSLY